MNSVTGIGPRTTRSRCRAMRAWALVLTSAAVENSFIRHRGEKTLRELTCLSYCLEFETAMLPLLFMIQAIGSVLPLIPAFTHLVEEIRVVR